jgi:hypothetical protein
MSFPIKCSFGDNSLNAKYHLNESSFLWLYAALQLHHILCKNKIKNLEHLHTCSPFQKMWYSKSLNKSWKQFMKGETYCEPMILTCWNPLFEITSNQQYTLINNHYESWTPNADLERTQVFAKNRKQLHKSSTRIQCILGPCKNIVRSAKPLNATLSSLVNAQDCNASGLWSKVLHVHKNLK